MNLFTDEEDEEDEEDDDLRPTSSTSTFKRVGSARFASSRVSAAAASSSFKRAGSLRRSGRGGAASKRDPAEVLRLKRVRRAKANDRERNRYNIDYGYHGTNWGGLKSGPQVW